VHVENSDFIRLAHFHTKARPDLHISVFGAATNEMLQAGVAQLEVERICSQSFSMNFCTCAFIFNNKTRFKSTAAHFAFHPSIE